MNVYEYIMHNGTIINKENAVISVFNPALTGVLGVYESMLLRNGNYVAIKEHLQRLLQSIQGAQLRSNLTMDKLLKWSFLTAMSNNRPEGVVRIMVLDLGNPYADIYFYEKPYKPLPAKFYSQGVPVILFTGERSFPQIKSLNTLAPGLARKAAQAAGAHDALLVNRAGCITEGSNCNVFAVQDGVLLAPPADDVLAGTVMQKVMQLARDLNMPLARRPMPAADVSQWQEVFLTSTQRGVLPVRSIGDVVLGAPGPVTRRLHKAYRAWEDSTVGL